MRAGWILAGIPLAGRIDANGKASLLARGVTSDPKYSVERVPTLSRPSYHVDAQFDEKRGTGRRVELRKYDVSFIRQ